MTSEARSCCGRIASAGGTGDQGTNQGRLLTPRPGALTADSGRIPRSEAGVGSTHQGDAGNRSAGSQASLDYAQQMLYAEVWGWGKDRRAAPPFLAPSGASLPASAPNPDQWEATSAIPHPVLDKGPPKVAGPKVVSENRAPAPDSAQVASTGSGGSFALESQGEGLLPVQPGGGMQPCGAAGHANSRSSWTWGWGHCLPHVCRRV